MFGTLDMPKMFCMTLTMTKCMCVCVFSVVLV